MVRGLNKITGSDIIIYKSKKKAAYIILLSVVSIIIGILILANNNKPVAGWSIEILGFLFLLYGLYSLFDARPQLIINSDGISSRSHRYELIEWKAVLASGEFWFRGQYYIRLVVPADYKPSLIPALWFYRVDKIYTRTSQKPVYLKVSMLELSSQEIIKIIRSRTKTNDPSGLNERY